MPRSWKAADQSLAQATAPATDAQRRLARFAGIGIADDTPTLVAAAVIRGALSRALQLPEPRARSERYEALLELLRRDSDAQIEPQNDDEAEAWVGHLRLLRRRECLSRLQVEEGDILKLQTGDLAELSSIGEDGRLYFKGGRGLAAWPDQVTVAARYHEQSEAAVEARKQARNIAARRRSSSYLSAAKLEDLEEFRSTSSLTAVDIETLEEVVEQASDGRPIQDFLESNPHLLTALLGGSMRFCVPQKRLGSEYVPDFVVGDVNSLGIRWVLVELETPSSGIYTRHGRSLDKHARQGSKQINEWRDWLSSNVDYAQRRRNDSGLGFFDIRDNPDAIVLVGQRSLLPETKDAERREAARRSNIDIHTYDWLLERLRGTLLHEGPPATNSNLL